ncbi:MAG: 30S ribosomal protein S1 [Planctomycetes bacterium]|nr:30S ribosomal protein S1 [Planctomycetota bacterium]
MQKRQIQREYGLNDTDVDREVQAVLGQMDDPAQLEQLYEDSIQAFETGSVVAGRVVRIIGNDAVIDVGFKSEGSVPLEEFDGNAVVVGQKVDVLLEAVEDESGLVLLSKRKADRIKGWERILNTYAEGDVVEGRVSRKIKGGLLVDIGVPVFLPASQVDIRRPADVSTYIGDRIKCKILKIDADRRNIVVSRRRLIEEEREEAKRQLLATMIVGQLRDGVVKNIADFGAFVDLGGIDGLLHITDMAWGRVGHPSEAVSIDQKLTIKILSIDREKEKVALGLKQKTASPWHDIETKYPIGEKVAGEVVNITPYGAFVKLEEGIEGLVHVSEMSWTRRVNHPSEIVSVSDEVKVVVLAIDKAKQEISLGMKQTEVNPWTLVKEKYPPGSVVEGVVQNLANYGAFIEIEEGIDGLLHVSDMSWTQKVNHPSEVLKKGQKLTCQVLSVDQDKKRVALGMKQLEEDPWERRIPETYVPGAVVRGKVTKVTNFGVFVELEGGLEGLLHVSELADHKVENPEEVVKLGEEIDVKVLRVDTEDRKIGLSLKRVQWAAEEGEEEAPAPEPARAEPRLGGIEHAEEGAVAEAGAATLFGTPLPAVPREEEVAEKPEAKKKRKAKAKKKEAVEAEEEPAAAEEEPAAAEEEPAAAEEEPAAAEEEPAAAEEEPAQAEEESTEAAEAEPKDAEAADEVSQDTPDEPVASDDEPSAEGDSEEGDKA